MSDLFLYSIMSVPVWSHHIHITVFLAMGKFVKGSEVSVTRISVAEGMKNKPSNEREEKYQCRQNALAFLYSR